MTDLETLITKLRKASQTMKAIPGRGDPDPQDEYKPALTAGERDYLVFLLERERHVREQRREPAFERSEPQAASCDVCQKSFVDGDDVVLMGARGNFHQKCFLARAEPQAAQSYADLSDSATTFDPERRFDQDREDEG